MVPASTSGLLRRCALLLSFAVAPAFAQSPPGSTLTTTWFDRQLDLQIESLALYSHSPAARDQAIAAAMLDRINALRDQVSNPAKAEAVIVEAAQDSKDSVVRSEALYLAARIARHHGKVSAATSSTAINEFLNSAKAGQSTDLELLDSAQEIAVTHGLAQTDGLERAAELSSTADSWYRFAQFAGDDFHRVQGLRRALALDPSYIPAILDVARRYSAQGEPTRARNLLTASLQQNPQEPALRALLAELDLNQGRDSDALLALNALSSQTLSLNVIRDVAKDYEQIGLLSQARKLAHRAWEESLDNVADRELVLRLDQQALDSEAIRRDRAIIASMSGEASFEPSHDIENADPEVTRLRHLLDGDTQANGSDDHDGKYLANVDTLLRQWREAPASRRAESRMLADIRVDTLNTNYQTVQRVQQLIAVGSDADLKSYEQRAIEYSPESQQLNVRRMRVHRLSGETFDADDMGENAVADASVAMYYDLRERQYRFRHLRAGDVIEIDYSVSAFGSTNIYGNYFAEVVAFGGSLPRDVQRYVLCAPANIALSSAERMVDPPHSVHENNENILIWEKKQIPAFTREPRSPSWSEQAAYVHVSNFDSWQALGGWYAGLLRPQLALNSELQRIAEEITRQHPNRLDRVAAIDDLVLQRTRYVALEFGVYGFKPYPVSQTFARKFGDCKDKASLMVALLRAAGINAQIALLRTQALGEILPHPASVSIFDHAIVYIPEFDLWLDGTAEFSRLHELPVEDQGVMALTVDLNGDAELRRTPQSTASDNYSQRTIQAQMDADGALHFSGATYVRGEDAPELRRDLDPHEATISYVRDHLAQALPAVEVRRVELPQNSPSAVSLTFSGDSDTFRGTGHASLPSSWMRRNYLASLAPAISRSQALVLDAPWTTEEEIHIHLPGNAHLVALPQTDSIHSDFGRAELHYDLSGDDLTISSAVQFSQTHILPKNYAAFREFILRVDEAFRRRIEVALR